MREAVIVPIHQRALEEYQTRAKELIELSEAILDAAQMGDWGLALARQRQRSVELERFFATDESNISQEVAELITGCIRKMLQTDAKVTHLAYSGREALEREADVVQKQGRAARAYLGQTTS